MEIFRTPPPSALPALPLPRGTSLKAKPHTKSKYLYPSPPQPLTHHPYAEILAI